MLRSGEEEHDEVSAPTTMSAARIAWTCATVILMAEFADLTQLATAGFAARFEDPVAVAVGAGAALMSVSGLAVVAGAWLATRLPMRTIRRVAAVIFLAIGVATLASVF